MPYYQRYSGYRNYRINQYISAPNVRLIDEDAKQIGVMTISEARQQSEISGLDLIEIAPKATPPVVKLISLSKFKYQEAKKLKAEKKGIKGGELKEIQMTPFISQNDFDTRVRKAKDFLSTGNKIKLSVKFQGRQIAHQEFGYKIVQKFKDSLIDEAQAEGEAKLIGKRLFTTFSPIKNKKIKNEKSSPTSQS